MPKRAVLGAEQVFARVDQLLQSADMQAYQRYMRENWDLHTMQHDTVMPEYVTRRANAKVTFPSPFIMQTSQNLLASVNSFPRHLTINAINSRGVATADERSTADKIERHDTIARMKLDKDAHVTPQTYWHQVNSGFGVVVERCLPPPRGDARKRPFVHLALDTPDPTACGFPVRNGGTFRPAEFGMKQRVLVSIVEDDYADFDGSGFKPITHHGKWVMVALDSGRAETEADSRTGWRPNGRDAKDAPFEAELYYYDNGSHQYHAVKGIEGGRDTGRFASRERNGTILWQDENPIGRVMAWVVPGQATPLRQPGKQMLAVLEALIANEKIVNFLQDFVGTVALTNPTDMVINASPEQLQTMKDLGLVQPASSIEMQAGGPYLIHVGGQAQEWKWAPIEGPIELLKLKREDSIVLANDWKPLIDKELLAQGTATSVSLGTESQEQLKHDMLVHQDDMWTGVMQDYNDAAAKYYGVAPMVVYAPSSIRRSRGEPIAEGAASPLSEEDLDLEYELRVFTRQETEGQMGMRLQQAMLEEDRGYTTHAQAIGVKYSDATAQLKELARDLGRGVLQPALVAVLDLVTSAELLTEAGIRVPDSMIAQVINSQLGIAPGGGMEGPAPVQPQVQTFQPPATNGAMGEGAMV